MTKKKIPIYALEDPAGYGLSRKQELKLWQESVNSGIVWKLQGWYGRRANDLLKAGLIKYPKNRTYDYYGNAIPTHKEYLKFKKGKKLR